MTDADRVKMFLRQYVERLRRDGTADDQYKADAIEELLRRI